MNQFYVFKAYNAQKRYGYGSEEDAEAYCVILDRGRTVNLYSAIPLTVEEAVIEGLIRDDVVMCWKMIQRGE